MALEPLIMSVLAKVTGVAAVIGILANWLLLRRLRFLHYEKWQSLGRPNLFTWPYGKAGAAYWRFVWGNDLAALEDRALLVLQKVMRVSGYAFQVLFVCYWLVVGLHKIGAPNRNSCQVRG